MGYNCDQNCVPRAAAAAAAAVVAGLNASGKDLALPCTDAGGICNG